jgi:hypothetical protein
MDCMGSGNSGIQEIQEFRKFRKFRNSGNSGNSGNVYFRRTKDEGRTDNGFLGVRYTTYGRPMP